MVRAFWDWLFGEAEAVVEAKEYEAAIAARDEALNRAKRAEREAAIIAGLLGTERKKRAEAQEKTDAALALHSAALSGEREATARADKAEAEVARLTKWISQAARPRIFKREPFEPPVERRRIAPGVVSTGAAA